MLKNLLKGVDLKVTPIILMIYKIQLKFNNFSDDEILDTKTTERSLVKRQAVVKSSFTFPSPPLVHFNGKKITFVETLVTSDTMDVDVDLFNGGIGKDKMILIVSGYNAQILNVRVTVYGISAK